MYETVDDKIFVEDEFLNLLSVKIKTMSQDQMVASSTCDSWRLEATMGSAASAAIEEPVDMTSVASEVLRTSSEWSLVVKHGRRSGIPPGGWPNPSDKLARS